MTTTTRTVYGVAARLMRPTKRHRPALWSGVLGTVYALSPERETRYFDYDVDAAREWAGVDTASDPRLARGDARGRYRWSRSGAGDSEPRAHQRVLWVVDEPREEVTT